MPLPSSSRCGNQARPVCPEKEISAYSRRRSDSDRHCCANCPYRRRRSARRRSYGCIQGPTYLRDRPTGNRQLCETYPDFEYQSASPRFSLAVGPKTSVSTYRQSLGRHRSAVTGGDRMRTLRCGIAHSFAHCTDHIRFQLGTQVPVVSATHLCSHRRCASASH